MKKELFKELTHEQRMEYWMREHNIDSSFNFWQFFFGFKTILFLILILTFLIKDKSTSLVLIFLVIMLWVFGTMLYLIFLFSQTKETSKLNQEFIQIAIKNIKNRGKKWKKKK